MTTTTGLNSLCLPPTACAGHPRGPADAAPCADATATRHRDGGVWYPAAPGGRPTGAVITRTEKHFRRGLR